MQVIAKQKTYSSNFRGAKLLIYNNYKKTNYIQNIIKNIHSCFLKQLPHISKIHTKLYLIFIVLLDKFKQHIIAISIHPNQKTKTKKIKFKLYYYEYHNV